MCTINMVPFQKVKYIIAVSDDPTENINTMESVDFVMKKGKVYKNQ